MQVCYTIQPGTCHAQQWKVYPLSSGLWAEAANTATLLENNLTTPSRTLSPFQQFFGKGKKNDLTSMQKFGEMCIATYKDNNHWAKLANCGTPGIWVGYAKNYPLVHTGFSTQKPKKIFWPGTWLSYKRPMVSIPRTKNLPFWLWVIRGQMRRTNLKWFL